MRLNVSTRVPTEVTTFFLTVGSTVIEVQVKVEDGVGWYFVNINLFYTFSSFVRSLEGS